MFLSERFNVKDAGVLAGAVAAATKQTGIGTAATKHNTAIHVAVGEGGAPVHHGQDAASRPPHRHSLRADGAIVAEITGLLAPPC